MDQLFEPPEHEPEPSGPLPARMRPRSVDEVVGQEHLLGRGHRAARAIEHGPAVLDGPLRAARARARRRSRGSSPRGRRRLRGAQRRAGRQGRGRRGDRRARARALKGDRRTVLFLDEIHRFNKAQQDALLPGRRGGHRHADRRDDREPVLRGQLRAALPDAGLRAAAARAPRTSRRCCAAPTSDGRVGDDVVAFLADRSGGDARTALARAGDRARSAGDGDAGGRRGRAAAPGRPLRQGRRPALRPDLGVDQGDARQRPRRLALLPRGDARGRRGPALHRPAHGHPRLRGHRQRRPAARSRSPSPPRRRSSTSGCPSASYALAQCAIYLSLAPKSNAAYKAIAAARAHVREHGAQIPPAHLRSAAYAGAQQLGRGSGYDYPHDRPGHVSGAGAAARRGRGHALLRARRGRGAACRPARGASPRKAEAGVGESPKPEPPPLR